MALAQPSLFRRPIHPRGDASLLATQRRAPPPVAPTTFDPNRISHGTFATLSNGNLTATGVNGTSGEFGGVGTTTTRSNGKWVVGFSFDSCAGATANAGTTFGFADTAFDFTDIIQFINNTHTMGWQCGPGSDVLTFWVGTTTIDLSTINGGGWTVPTVLGHQAELLLDFTNSLLYLAVDGSPISGMDPVAGTGGISFAGMGVPLMAALAHGDANVATIIPTPTYVPVGYSTWDASSAGNISGASSLTFTPSATSTGLGTLGGASSLVLAPTGTATGLAALTGTSALTFAPSATTTGLGGLIGSSTLVLSPSGTATGLGSLIGSSPVTFAPTGTVRGLGALAGTAPLSWAGSGTLSGLGSLLASTALSFSLSGTVGAAGSNAIAGTSSLAFAPVATLTGRGQVSASTSFSLTISGHLFAGSFGDVKVRVLDEWQAKPVKVWDGVTWVEKPLKRWTGSIWQATSY